MTNQSFRPYRTTVKSGSCVLWIVALLLLSFNAISQPATPTANPATSVTSTSFQANWSSVSGITGYSLDVSTVSNFATFVTGYHNKIVGSPTVNLASVTGLSPNTTYYYRVRAQNSGGNSGYSGTIIVDPLLPAPTANAATSITSTSFTANWQAVSGAGGYYVDYSSNGFTSWATATVTGATTKVITVQSSGITYQYRVKAYNNSGAGPASSVISVLIVCAAPTANAATNASSNSFTANWSASTGAASYRLDVSTVNNFASYVSGYQDLTVAGASASVTGLTLGSTYYYRVRGVNASGTSPNSSTITQATVVPAPVATAPTNLGSTSFTANWGAVSGATSYKLDISTVSNFSSFVSGYNGFVVVATSFNVNPVTANTTYYYRVRAVVGALTSAVSNTINFTTLFAGPTSLAATSVTATSFNANWNSVGSAQGYRLDVATDNGFTNMLAAYNNLSIGVTTTYLVNGLNAGSTYYYRVRWQNSGATSASSGYIVVMTVPNPPGILPPTSVTTTSFTANWNSSAGATYQLDISLNSGFSSFIAGYNNLSVSSSTVNIPGLSNATTYYYRVRAVNSGGTSVSSATSSTTTHLVAPVATAATIVQANTFTANWGVVSLATSYNLEVSTSITFSTSIYSFTPIPVTTNSKALVTSGNSVYYYRVSAVNALTNSVVSNVITVLTLPDPPVATGGSEVTTSSFKANWTAVPGITSYLLDVASDFQFQNLVAGYIGLPVNGTIQLVSGLNQQMTYYYRVRAVNASGNSDWSNVATGVSLDKNYIKEVNAHVPGLLTQTQLDGSVIGQRMIVYTFFDGLGRASQKVLQQNSPLQFDVVQPMHYDAAGREDLAYLPYRTTDNNGWYKFNPVGTTTYTGSPHNLFYTNGSGDKVQDDNAPYSRRIFDASPLNRVNQEGGAGEAWQPNPATTYNAPVATDHSIKHGYQYNDSLEVYLFKYDPVSLLVTLDPNPSLKFYARNQLQANKVRNEANNAVIEYVDKFGHVVCKKVQSGGSLSAPTYISTYYVFDDVGNLVVVLPPEAFKAIIGQ